MSEAIDTTPQEASNTPVMPPIRTYQPEDVANVAFDAQFGPARPEIFQADAILPYFARMREEAPLHYTADSDFGAYWSVTRYEDIMAIDTDHETFSSEGGITVGTPDEDFQLPMFIAMDQPKHDEQRKVVSPVVGPRNLAAMESTIRERAGDILDSLPRGETFNWVDLVSIEQTTQMLATLFDFPWEDRRKLTRWSDVATAAPGTLVANEEERRAELLECLQYFVGLWNERVNLPEPGNDLISMLAHGEATKNMEPMEYLGNLILLIVGGNDTTRNTISASVLALNENPDQFAKLRANPELIPNMVSETIRWQTPLAHMRRTANRDVEMHGQTIKKGDKVVMWYVSGNRDPKQFENPNAYQIDRPNARQHMAFGFGLHRCMGNRLAELQLKVVWEEILKRFDKIEVVGDVERSYSSFVRGYTNLPVRLPA